MSTRNLIAYDIDGMLTREVTSATDMEALYEARTPHARARIQLLQLYARGFVIYLYTGRKEKYRKLTEDWLDKHGFKYHFLIMDKPPYTYFVCDRGRTMAELDMLLEGPSPTSYGAGLMHCVCRRAFRKIRPALIVPTWPEMPHEYKEDRDIMIMDILRIFPEQPAEKTERRKAVRDYLHMARFCESQVVPWDTWPEIIENGLMAVWAHDAEQRERAKAKEAEATHVSVDGPDRQREG